MLSPCIICYKLNCSSNSPAELRNVADHEKISTSGKGSEEALSRFFKVLERCIGIGIRENDNRETEQFYYERLITAGLYACKDCSKIMESFVKLYHQIKSTELLLTWKLETLANIMSTAQIQTSRLDEFRRGAKQLEKDDLDIDELIKLKMDLVQKCMLDYVVKSKRKLRGCPPRIRVQKYKGGAPTPTPNVSNNSLENCFQTEISIESSPSDNSIEHVEDVEIADPLYYDAIPVNSNVESFANDNLEAKTNHMDVIQIHTASEAVPDIFVTETESVTIPAPLTEDIKESKCVKTFLTSSLNKTLDDPSSSGKPKGNSLEEFESDETNSEDSESDYYNDPEDDQFTNEDENGQLASNCKMDADPSPTTRDMDVDKTKCEVIITKPIVAINNEGDSANAITIESPPSCINTARQRKNRKSELHVKNNPNTNSPGRTQPSRFSLRNVYRCKSCSRTFSTNERLCEHQKSEDCSRSTNDLNDNREDTRPDDHEKCKNTTIRRAATDIEEDYQSSEEESESDGGSEDEFGTDNVSEEEDLLKPNVKVGISVTENAELVEDDKHNPLQCSDCHKSFAITGGLRRHRILCHPIEWREKLGANATLSKIIYRFKCPDCDKLFPELQATLLHKSQVHNNNSMENDEDPDSKLKGLTSVQILSFLKKPGSSLSERTTEFRVFATIEAPEKLFVCDVSTCQKMFYFSDEFENHTKLHGNFKCQFCNESKTYAPDLAEHELRHYKEKRKKMRKPPKDFKSGKHICARCNVPFWNSTIYINHHLTSHQGLSKISSSACAICKIGDFHCNIWDKNSDKSLLFLHYKMSHDKEGTSKELKRCKVENCPAYFIKQSQLSLHLRDCHKMLRGKTQKKCEICGKEFSQRSMLEKHQQNKNTKCRFDENDTEVNHEEEELQNMKGKSVHLLSTLKCPTCNLLFSRVHQLLLHHKESHPHPPNESEDDHITIEIVKGHEYPNNVKRLRVVAKVKVPLALQICPISNCNQVFFREVDLQDHSKLHGRFPCQFCDVVEIFAPGLAEHELKHNGTLTGNRKKKRLKNGNLDCPRCKLSLKDKKDYILHHLDTHQALPLIWRRCPICKTKSCSNVRLHDHFKRCHNLKDIDPESVEKCKAGDCTAYFLTSLQLYFHYKAVHHYSDTQVEDIKRQTLRKAFQCSDCGKRYSKAVNLRNHRLKVHVTQKDAIHCTFANCTKKFESKGDMDSHIRCKHGKNRTWKECPKCKKMLPVENIKRHLKVHKRMEDIAAGIAVPKPPPKQVVCETCGKVFREKTTLERHYLSHSGPESWQFTCGVCSKKCSTKYKLAEHMMTHNKEKPFVCEICGQKYAHRHNLRIHVNSKHGSVMQDIPRKCDKTNLTSRKGIKRKPNRDDDGESSTDSD